MKILVFNPSFLGDSVLTTPLIKAVKSYLSDNPEEEAVVDFCVRPEFAPLFEGLELINKVIPFDKRGNEKGLSGIFRFAGFLKLGEYDVIISPHKSFRSTLLLGMTGVIRRIGFRQAAFSFVYPEKVERNMELHEVERNLMLLEPFITDFALEDAKRRGGRPEVFIDESYSEKVSRYFKAARPGGRVIALAPGSVWATKKWPAQRFAKVADMIYEAGDIPLIIGGPMDRDAADELKSHMRHTPADFCGFIPLRRLPALIDACDLLITNDSGPLHIAVAVGTPATAIFGPTVKGLGFFPYTDNSAVVEEDLYCRPCGLHGGNECPEEHFRCMLDITPERVYETAEGLL
ncbi:glycosyltransferase family 9 protein [Limisalsivibrio acetivorans]|uniref:glycosyltransferase family 9 protein n=1 Tax=Limisalsivibrio acetivorans TaxID=1304888 RepID=UPI0003B542FE|nr:glycosyltransferase family 9 protein [Limisalsivibrio acetivorans]